MSFDFYSLRRTKSHLVKVCRPGSSGGVVKETKNSTSSSRGNCTRNQGCLEHINVPEIGRLIVGKVEVGMKTLSNY